MLATAKSGGNSQSALTPTSVGPSRGGRTQHTKGSAQATPKFKGLESGNESSYWSAASSSVEQTPKTGRSNNEIIHDLLETPSKRLQPKKRLQKEFEKGAARRDLDFAKSSRISPEHSSNENSFDGTMSVLKKRIRKNGQ